MSTTSNDFMKLRQEQELEIQAADRRVTACLSHYTHARDGQTRLFLIEVQHWSSNFELWLNPGPTFGSREGSYTTDSVVEASEIYNREAAIILFRQLITRTKMKPSYTKERF